MKRAWLLLLVARVAHADLWPSPTTSALPCRPTIACTADLVPPGVLELEAGYIYRRLAHDVNESSLPFLLKLSLSGDVQLQVGSNGLTLAGTSRYFDDVTLGGKVRIVHQREYVPAISLSAALSVPTATASGYLRTYDALFTLYVTKDFDWLHADWNVGFNEWSIDGSPLAQGWTALALSVPLGHGFGAMGESYYFTDSAPIAPRDAGILAALSYQPRKWIVFDAGPDLGLLSTRAISLFFGMTIIPLDLWDTADELHGRGHS